MRHAGQVVWSEYLPPITQYLTIPPDPSYPSVQVGIEIEVENCPRVDVPGWNWHEEPSLRSEFNSEYVTRGSHYAGNSELALNTLFRYLIPGYNFPYTCSTHVHCNVRGWTDTQFATLMATYYSVEDLLFAFVGEDRRNSNYCVPWTSTNIHSTFRSWDMNFKNINSDKYAALNFCNIRIVSKGTVEFRHFPGAEDLQKLLLWIKLITRLVDYSSKTLPETQYAALRAMKTLSNHREYLVSIFGDVTDALVVPNMAQMLQRAAKAYIAALVVPEVQLIPCTPNSPLSTRLKLTSTVKRRKIAVKPPVVPNFDDMPVIRWGDIEAQDIFQVRAAARVADEENE